MGSTLRGAAALAIVLVSVPASQAQGPTRPPMSGMPRPVVSPYLNLLNTGDSAINYFGLVRPQIAFRGAINSLQGEVDTMEKRDSPTQTGHASSFMTQSRYFMTNGAGGGGVASPSNSAGAVPKRR